MSETMSVKTQKKEKNEIILGQYYYRGKGIIEPEINLQDLLIELLKEYGPCTREKLAQITNIPRTTLYDNLAQLIHAGKARKYPVKRKTRGRPKVLFELV